MDKKYTIKISSRVEGIVEFREFDKLEINKISNIDDIKYHFFVKPSESSIYYDSYVVALLKDYLFDNKRSNTRLDNLKIEAIRSLIDMIDYTRFLIFGDEILSQKECANCEVTDWQNVNLSNYDDEEKYSILQQYYLKTVGGDIEDTIDRQLKGILKLSEFINSNDLTDFYDYYAWHDFCIKNNILNYVKNDKMKEQRCVAYFKSNERNFVAFSGSSLNYVGNTIKKWTNKYGRIESIVKKEMFTNDDIVFCQLQDSCLRYLELDNFTKLSTPEQLCENYDSGNKQKLAVSYSCCERKITSYLNDNEYLIKGIISYAPCSKCQPALASYNNLEIYVPRNNNYPCVCPILYRHYHIDYDKYSIIQGKLVKQ